MMEIAPMDSYETGLVLKAPEPVKVFAESMEVETNVLQEFYSSKCYVSTLCEGYFAVLMKDLRKEVWSQISDDKTFAVAMRVNKRWRSELEEAWKQFCVERGIFDDYWFSVGKDWKWQLRAWKVVYAEGAIRDGPGTFHDKNGPYTGDWKENKQDGWERRSFQTTASTWDNGRRTSSTERELMCGKIRPNIVVPGRTTSITALVSRSGATETVTKECGSKIRSTDMELTFGPTEIDTTVNGPKTSNMALESLSGVPESSMLACSRTICEMIREPF